MTQAGESTEVTASGANYSNVTDDAKGLSADEIVSSDFADTLNENIENISSYLSQAAEEIDSTTHYIYYTGDGSDLLKWESNGTNVVLKASDDTTAESSGENASSGSQTGSSTSSSGSSSGSSSSGSSSSSSSGSSSSSSSGASSSSGTSVTNADGSVTTVNTSDDGTVTLTVSKTNDNGKVTNTDYKVTSDNTVTLTEIETDAKSYTVPAKITGTDGTSYKVTKIAKNAMKNNDTVTTVKIGNNVKTIGKGAFAGCSALKKAVMGKNVTKIAANAFKGDKSLKSIKINSSSLKPSGIGKNSLSGINKNAVIKVKSSDKKSLKQIKKAILESGNAPSGVKVRMVK